MTDNLKQTTVPVSIPSLDGDEIAETHYLQVPVRIDPHTGEEMLTEEAIQLIEDAKARYMGLLLAGEIREMRKRVGLTQRRISELFQAGEKSWTRWESGRARPSRMVNVLLRLVYEGKVFISDLIAQRKQGINWREKVVFKPQWKPAQSTTQTSQVAQWAAQCSGLSPPHCCHSRIRSNSQMRSIISRYISTQCS